MDWNPPHPPTTQTFNCQYLSHFSTNWAEIFSGNPLVDDSNIQTTKKFKLQLDASIRNFVSHFFLSPIMSETFPHITQNISPYHQKAPFFLKFWFLTANISAISQPIELKFFFGNPPVGNSNVKTTKNFKLQLGVSIASFVGHCQYLSYFSTNWAEKFFW